MTQTERVLDLLRSRGRAGVTALDALSVVGSFRLAARIKDLREGGHDIETQIVVTPTRKRIARYVLHEKRQLDMGLSA